jgi:hypothetical protein
MIKAFEESKIYKALQEKGAELQQQSEEKKSQLTGEKSKGSVLES